MKAVFTAVALALVATHAAAAPVSGTSGTGNATVSGQTGVATFDSTPIGTYSTLTSGNVTVTGIGGAFRVANDYAGQYNGRGNAYVDNNQGGTSALRFDFATLVSGFAFNWGASDVAWTLSAFNAAGTLLDTLITPVTYGSNAGDFIGLADAGIKYATLTSSTPDARDYVFVDNIAYAAAPLVTVPEPGSFALMGLGVVGLVALRRRRLAAL